MKTRSSRQSAAHIMQSTQMCHGILKPLGARDQFGFQADGGERSRQAKTSESTTGPHKGSPHPSLFFQDPGLEIGEAGWGPFWPMRLFESNGTRSPLCRGLPDCLLRTATPASPLPRLSLYRTVMS